MMMAEVEMDHTIETHEILKDNIDIHQDNESINLDSSSSYPLSNGHVEPESFSTEQIVSKIRKEYESSIAQLKLEVQQKEKEAKKDKETMVMRYANSEKEILKLRKEIDNYSKSFQNMNREIDSLNKKNKMLGSERERLINIIDARVNDVQTLQKECDKLKEDNSSKDFKIKWIQNKLNTESDAYKQSQTDLEQCRMELIEAKEEVNRMRKDCQDMINSYKKDPILSSGIEPIVNGNTEDQEDKQAELPLNPFQKELSILKGKHQALIQENNSLSTCVQNLQEQRLDLEKKLTRLQESNADHLHQIASLQSDLATAESMRIQLHNEQERVIALQSENDTLRALNNELLAEMSLCRGKEAELLGYTQQVTEKNVALQSEFTSVEAKCSILERENQRLLTKIEDSRNEIKCAEKIAYLERKNLQEEKENLLIELKTEREKINSLEHQLDETSGEIMLLKKKHEITIWELTKELKLAMRVVKDGTNGSSVDGMSQSSRTSSNSSLNNVESLASVSHSPRVQNDSSNHAVVIEKVPEQMPVIPDQLVLVERIVKLQKMLAKKQEKNDFLEEYAKELRETAQKQRKVIQAYAMCQEPGAMTSDLSDQNKQLIGNLLAAEFVKHGGVMGSLYASKASDEGLTLELSLEINRKLQAVLEDTLLKNITLKDSLSTLGEENSKLTDKIRKLTTASVENGK